MGRLFLCGARETVTFLKLGGGLRPRSVCRLALRDKFGGAFVDPARLEVAFDFAGECLFRCGGSFFQVQAAGGKHGSRGDQGEEQASGHKWVVVAITWVVRQETTSESF